MSSKLRPLLSYSAQQVEEAQKFSSAFQNFVQIAQRPSELHGTEKLAETLRQLRQTKWLEALLAELHQTASTQDICEDWSTTADQIIRNVCDHLSQEFPGKLALFAYGKLGSSELNLSSDIDLVFICSSDSLNHIPFIRRFQNLIHEPTSSGFCYRTDFDLRPGGRMGPLVPTLDQFEDYYGNYGEAWERLAFVRLRPIWGDEDIQSSVMKFVQKFTFRKHLDYTLLSDLKTLRQKIHSQYAHRSSAEQIDLKLGLGGIRDLELFVHALQVVHGGKDLELRQKRTSDAFLKIEEAQIIPPTDVQFLRTHYWILRHWENLVQAEMDLQTHILKADFSLLDSDGKIFQELLQSMQKCDQIVSTLLGKVDLKTRTLPGTEEEQHAWLAQLGFSADAIEAAWKPLFVQTALSRQKERDESLRQRFLYLFVEELSHFKESQNRSLFLLRDFVKATRAKATFYALFLNQENLIPQIARIFATSPYLAGILSSRPELIDSFVYKNHSPVKTEDPAIFLEALGEKKLLSELINGSEFLSSLNLQQMTERISEVADSITQELLGFIDLQKNLQLLPLGKWGGGELGLRSDLDFVFLTENDTTEDDIRRARRFFNRLTETHQRGGSLYSIDLRLKPAGKGGLVVTSQTQLLEYLSTTAQAWERQAYLRSRPFEIGLREKILQACLKRKISTTEVQELSRIRNELQKNSQTSSNKFDLKYGPGGLVDIEFAAQVAFLVERTVPLSPKTETQLEQLGWKELREGYVFMRLVEQLQQAVSITSSSCLEIGSESFKFVSGLLHLEENELEKRLRSAFQSHEVLLKRLDPRQAS